MEFTVETTFNISAKRLFNAYLDRVEHSAMTGGSALITQGEDDKFSAWDGYIWGTNLKLERYGYIKQAWRTSDFDEDQEDSIVEIFFESIRDEETIMRIKHSHLNDKDLHYKEGWVDHYFSPMKAYFKSN